MDIEEFKGSSEDWDSLVLESGSEAGFLQSTHWAAQLERLDGAKAIRLMAKDGGKILAALMLLHKVPFDRNTGRTEKSIKSMIKGTAAGWLEAAHGPVIFDHDRGTESLKAILGWVAEYSGSRRIRNVSFKGFAPTSRYVADEGVGAVFQSFGYALDSYSTYLVDISQDEKALWESFDPAARKSTKKAQRSGVVTHKIDGYEDFVEKFVTPYRQFTERSGRSATPAGVFETVWKTPGHERFYHYYSAIGPEGSVLATLGMYVFGGVATEVISSLAPEAFEKKIPAQDVLHWEMFLDAKKMGCHTFDMAGVTLKPANSKEEGIVRFKKKWGGRQVVYHLYAKTSRPLAARMVSRVAGKRMGGPK